MVKSPLWSETAVATVYLTIKKEGRGDVEEDGMFLLQIQNVEFRLQQ